MRPGNNPTEGSANAAERQLDGDIDQSRGGRKKVRQHAIDAARDGRQAPEQIRLSIEDDGPGLASTLVRGRRCAARRWNRP